MQAVELTLMLLVAVAVAGASVRWSRLPLPIFLVVVGWAASFLPGLDAIEVDPELFLLLFIPPLLFVDAWSLPRRDFMRVVRPVLLLALGLVVLTVVAVGYFMHWLIPSMPLAVAFTLGAIVSPTDAVATVATTENLPLPAPRDAHRQRREPAQRRDRAGCVQAGGRRRSHRTLRLVGGRVEVRRPLRRRRSHWHGVRVDGSDSCGSGCCALDRAIRCCRRC